MATNNAINLGQYTFSGYLSSSIGNFTGDGSQDTIILDATWINEGNCYSTSTGIYTAPVTGNYFVSLNACFNNLTSSHTAGSVIIQPYEPGGYAGYSFLNPYACASSDYGTVTIQCNQMFPLSAGSSITFLGSVGGGTKTVTLLGRGWDPFPNFTTNITVFLML